MVFGAIRSGFESLLPSMKIELVDACADDLAVVNSARVSFAQNTAIMRKSDEGLIRFLMRDRHGSPFEHTYFRWHVEAPLFVFREWHRHRAGHSYNEMSGRYTKLERKFYYPEARVQEGKPGKYKFKTIKGIKAKLLKAILWPTYNSAYFVYWLLVKMGFAKEIARVVLPLATYSQMYWSCNSRSLMHFLGLRYPEAAQREMQIMCRQIEPQFAARMPITYEAFVKNGRVSP